MVWGIDTQGFADPVILTLRPALAPTVAPSILPIHLAPAQAFNPVLLPFKLVP